MRLPARRFLRAVWQQLRYHRALLLLLVLGIGLPWFIFLNIAEDIWESGGFWGDQTIMRFWHAHATPALDRLALALSYLGGPLNMTLLSGGIGAALFLTHRRLAARFFALAIGGAVFLNLSAKAFFGRARPSLWASIAPETSFSFPSGHAMGAAALAAALTFLFWPTRWRWMAMALTVLFALGVGWSRMYLGVHYPSDVVAGWVVSVGWVGGVHLFFSPAYHQLRQWVWQVISSR